MNTSPGQAQRGFSLLELMVTVAILAILASLAVPAFSDFIKRNAIASQTNEMIGALRLARSTAISRNVMVSVCPSANASSATPTCLTSASFDNGWLIYTTAAAATAYKSTDELLRVSQGASNVSIRTQSTGSAAIVTFDARGTAITNAVAFLICAKTGSAAVGASTPRAPGRVLSLQTGGRSGAAPLGTATSATAAQALCTTS
ncbi:GspH/FimT family pseudopilin [Luteibacter sp. 9135]|uniref:GspH/FimT family pseudopilin n=1 Tax=Luteibacter sp. 9135 TaxID=1500893 RepID=UPI0005649D1D|nr:GspH/FimT family pseudopilin [Luteibacter sp. 9135]